MTGTVVVAARPGPYLQAPRFSARIAGRSFCVRGGAECRGVALRVNVRRAGLAIGYLKVRPLRGRGAERAFGTIQLRLKAGRRTIRFKRSKDGKRLTPGPLPARPARHRRRRLQRPRPALHRHPVSHPAIRLPISSP